MADQEYLGSLEYVRDKIETEGFDYAFRMYSEFESVKDEEFHRLRKAYVEAAEALDAYLPDFDDEDDVDEEDDDTNQEEETE